MADPLATYLQELSLIKSSGAGVEETSGYTALSNLLNEVGKTLKPRVRCIINLRNKGAGLPDGGLFTPDQFQRASEAEPLPGQLPSRGAIEVKGTRQAIQPLADGEQVGRYLARYGQVLVTNYRDFILVGKDPDGARVNLEEYRLAPAEAAFWTAAAHPHKTAEEHGERFVEYLKRVMLHAAPIAAPKDVAWFLASYARDARARIEAKARAAGGELPALANVRDALEQALGIKFEGDKGEHFFRSTLVQTLFYGVFSAWVLWAKKHPPTDRKARFNWHEAAWSLHVPMIRALFEQVATPSRLGPLGLTEVLDWTGAVLNRVERATFFERFSEEHAVQYFYEPFLEAFDPVLRKELGVWYTPTEVVKYMVARVDAVLRSELDIPDGLADPRVYVLDPCCGTGAYLVEVIRRIHDTMSQGGGDALIGDDLKHAAMERVFGFEILPAPFVVAHLQMGLTLQNLGARLDDARDERVGVYLTNALTGWEPPTGPKQRLIFPELEEERDAADRVKRATPILVVLGNPPYNGYPGVGVSEERELSNAYRETRRAPEPQGRGLNDLFVRFFRIAERRIVEQTGQGVVCLISNYAWLDGLSYTGMRERYLEAFDGILIDSLNGDKYRTGKLTPTGEPDPSVFSTDWNREGIQVGTAITTLVRKGDHEACDHVRFRDFWGVQKREELRESKTSKEDDVYQKVKPALHLGLPFVPLRNGVGYDKWASIPVLFPFFFPGIQTARDAFLVDIDRENLVDRIGIYFDTSVTNDDMRRLFPEIMRDTGRYDAVAIRDRLRARGMIGGQFVRYCYRPFDLRWLYWEPDTKLLDEKRTEFFNQVFDGNVFLVTQQKPRRVWSSAQAIRNITDLVLIDRGASCFPLQLRSVAREEQLFQIQDEPLNLTGENGYKYNLSEMAVDYLSDLRGTKQPERVLHHCLAVLHSVRYSEENTGALRQDWPRIPLPSTKKLLGHSSGLGIKVVALFDTESQVRGVTTNPIRAELKSLGTVSRAGGGSLSPDELSLTVGWGHPGKGGITMPGRGRLVERDYTPDEREAIREGAEALGLSLDDALGLLGPNTRDVYLNDTAFWRNVPARVWEYTIGGYQVVKKWLSYRERPLLGRALTPVEAREVRDMVRRIAALILLQPELDASYAAVKANVYDWPRAPQSQA
jgi:Type ISP C-terminal specificity domain/N-6 DNA Methylase